MLLLGGVVVLGVDDQDIGECGRFDPLTWVWRSEGRCCWTAAGMRIEEGHGTAAGEGHGG